MRRYVAVLVFLLLALGGSAWGQTTPALSVTGESGNAVIPATYGYEFNVVSDTNVTGLAVYDWAGDGLYASHDVGIWDSQGNLLCSATVPAAQAAPLDSSGKWRYVVLSSPVVLHAGNGYRVGAVFGGNDDLLGIGGAHVEVPSMSWAGRAQGAGDDVLTFPNNASADYVAYWAGSFVVGPAGDSGSSSTELLTVAKWSFLVLCVVAFFVVAQFFRLGR